MMRTVLPLVLCAASLAAQAPAKPAPKPNLEAQAARQAFQAMLDAVNQAWFGAPYRDINAVELQGTLRVEMTGKALNAKVSEATQGQVKGAVLQDGKAMVNLRSTYFANGDFKTEMGGAFGSLLYTRVGNRGFLFSRTQNTYTTRVEPPPSDAPLSYLGWFRSVLNDLKAVYVDSPAFKATLGGEQTSGGKVLQTLIFNAPTSPYDPKKREQSLDDTLGFWKRGRLELIMDKATRQPHQISFSNTAQGIRSQLLFAYDGQGRLERATLTNQSRGMEGPGFLQVAYAADGRMSHVNGELSSAGKRVAFDLALTWASGRKASSIVSVPPPSARKVSREELEVSLLAGLAGNILELQRAGLNLRSVPLAGK
jgi:hypothetical protein